jgi:hypothetical protein
VDLTICLAALVVFAAALAWQERDLRRRGR